MWLTDLKKEALIFALDWNLNCGNLLLRWTKTLNSIISSNTTALYFIATKIAPRLERKQYKESIFTKESKICLKTIGGEAARKGSGMAGKGEKRLKKKNQHWQYHGEVKGSLRLTWCPQAVAVRQGTQGWANYSTNTKRPRFAGKHKGTYDLRVEFHGYFQSLMVSSTLVHYSERQQVTNP